MDNLFSVEDKVVIITGAARGNGKAIAEGFLFNGAIVYFVDKIEEIIDIVKKTGHRNAHPVICDLANKNSMKELVSEVVSKNNRIDILVNNAGISLSSDDPYAEHLWDETFAINLKAVFILSNLVVDVMKRQRSGSIINITSLGAELGFPGNPSYVASKGGLKQLTKAMARDWAQFNIRVNNICPGYIRTNMTLKSYGNPKLKYERDNRIMLNRWGEPSDLVGPALFLASDASSYITGIDLPVDGGWLSKGL